MTVKKFVCLFWVARAIFQLSIAGDRAANLDLCLALTAFSSEGSFTCHTYCDTGPPFLRSYPKDPWFSLLNAVLLAKEQLLPILNFLGLTRPARAELELTTYRLLSESTTTRLRQPVASIARKQLVTWRIVSPLAKWRSTSANTACNAYGHFSLICSSSTHS
jgi:hypothetical protein